MSSRHLTRAKEHFGVKNIARTAIKDDDHLTNCDIYCDKAFGSAGLSSFSVLRSCRSEFDTKINEALFIKRLNLTNNFMLKDHYSY